MNWQKRKVAILVVLLGFWGLILVVRWPWSQTRPTVGSAAPTAARKPAAQADGRPRLKTELLRIPVPAYPPEVQNIFGTPPPPPPPPPTKPSPGLTPASALPPPPDPFQEDARQLKYVGFLQGEGKTMAFIMKGPELHTVEVGTTLLGRFRIQAVTEDAVLVSSVAGDKQIRLPLAVEAGVAPRP